MSGSGDVRLNFDDDNIPEPMGDSIQSAVGLTSLVTTPHASMRGLPGHSPETLAQVPIYYGMRFHPVP